MAAVNFKPLKLKLNLKNTYADLYNHVIADFILSIFQ